MQREYHKPCIEVFTLSSPQDLLNYLSTEGIVVSDWEQMDAIDLEDVD